MVQPAEIGIRQMDKRPYGSAGVQAEQMRRVRQQSERNTPPAEPMGAPQSGAAPTAGGPSTAGTMEWPAIDLNAPAEIEQESPPTGPPSDLAEWLRPRGEPTDPFAGLGGVDEAMRGAMQLIGQGFGAAMEIPGVGFALQALGRAWEETAEPIIGLAIKAADPRMQDLYERQRKTLEGGEASVFDYFATTRALRDVHRASFEEASAAAEDVNSPGFLRVVAGIQKYADVVAQVALPIPAAAEGAAIAKAGAAAAGVAKGAAKSAPKGAIAARTEQLLKVGQTEEQAAAAIIREFGAPNAQRFFETGQDVQRAAPEMIGHVVDAPSPRTGAIAARLRASGREADAVEIERTAPTTEAVPGGEAKADALTSEAKAPPTPTVGAETSAPGVKAPRPTEVDPSASFNDGVNLEVAKLPDELKSLIEERAIRYQDDIQTQRRGQVPMDELLDQASRLGVDVPRLATAPPGTMFAPAQIVAIYDGLIQKTDELKGLIADARTRGATAMSKEEQARLLMTAWEQATLQRVLAGGRAEYGRGMRAMQEMYKARRSGKVMDTFDRALEAVGGKANIDLLLRRLVQIQSDPTLTSMMRDRALVKFVGDSMRDVTFWDKIQEHFINAILSNPLTHQANILGQTALNYADLLSALPAAAADTVLSGFGTFRPRERTFSGAIASAVGQHAALERATREALLYLRTGVRAEDIEKFREGAKPLVGRALQGKIGTALNIPTRALGAEDVFFYTIGRERQLYLDAANAVAAQKGAVSPLSRRFWAEVQALANDPTPQMQARAYQAGRRAGMQQEAGQLAQALMMARDIEIPGKVPLFGGLRPLYFTSPFVRIAFNLISTGTEFSPLGFLRVLTKQGGERADAIGRATIGTALFWMFWQKADLGELTGAYPDSAAEREAWTREGKLPYAIRSGDEWVQYYRFAPITVPLMWVAELHEEVKRAEGKPFDQRLATSIGLKVTSVLARSVSDFPFMQGVSTLLDVSRSPEATLGQRGERFVGNTAFSLLPYSGMLRFISQTTDGTYRRPSDVIDQIMASFPGLSFQLNPQVGTWGEEVQRPEMGIGQFTRRAAKSDPVDEELSKVVLPEAIDEEGNPVTTREFLVGMVGKQIAGLDLSDDEWTSLQKQAGRATYNLLFELFFHGRRYQGKGWDEMNDQERAVAVRAVTGKARDVARANVADAILMTADTPQEVKRAAVMRLSTLRPRSMARAEFLAGLKANGKLTSDVVSFIDERKGVNEPTVAQYLRVVDK